MWTFSSDFIIIYKTATTMNLTQYTWRSMEDQAIVSSIHPWFVTGFTDAEGSFSLSISASSKYSSGFLVKLLFDIGLDKRDQALLEKIQSYFGVGKIYARGKSVIDYRVQSVEELEVIINHFDSYPLITQKWADYHLFKMAFEIIKRKEHLTTEGINKLLSIRASMNRGLSEGQKAAFSSCVPVERPELIDQIIPDPHWLVGFVDGEGCFFVRIQKSKVSLGESVLLKFVITQHVRDLRLIRSLENTFGCGRVEISNKGWAYYIVTVFSDILNNIKPFFDQYPLQGVKQKNFDDFSKVVSLMENKEHLTKEGLEKIKQIKLGMNKERKYGH